MTLTRTDTAAPASLRQRITMWAPCITMLMLSLISYVDRSVLSILSPTILHDLHLSQEQYGRALSAFMVCYMIANPAWGILMDRAGLFIATLAAVALWSIASGMHAFIGGFAALCIARAILGFGEGATFPAGLKTVVETLPKERRAFGLGLAYSGGSLGAAVTPLIVTPLALWFGWRAAFVMTAVVGMLWLVIWIAVRKLGLYRRIHETAVAETIAIPEIAKPVPGLRATALRMLGAACAYGLGAIPLAFCLYFAALYLNDVLHLSQSTIGKLLWIPPAGWETGYLIWGWVMDRRARLGHGRPLGLMVVLAIAGLGLMGLPALATLPHAVLLTMIMFYVAMFIAVGFVVAALADGMNGAHHTAPGLMAGLCISSWSLATAVLMPILGRLFDHGQFTLSIRIVAIIPIAGALLWWICSVLEKRVVTLEAESSSMAK